MNETDPQLRALQIIVMALVSGVVGFAGVAMAVAPTGSATTNLSQLRIVGVILLVTCLAGALGIKFTMAARRRNRRENPYAYTPESPDGAADPGAAAKFFIMTMLGSALAESVALYGAVVYMMSGQAVDLLTVVVPLLVMIGAFFPTRNRWEAYVGR